MKRPKKPTRAQKILISSRGLDPAEWFVTSDSKQCLMIKHRRNNRIRPVYKVVD